MIWARSYSAATGVFIQQDPIGFRAGSSNLYRYGENNPIGFTDSSGTIAISEYKPFLPQFAINMAAGAAGCVFGDLLEAGAGGGDTDPTVLGAGISVVTGNPQLPSGENFAESAFKTGIAFVLTRIFVGIGKAGDASLTKLPVAGTASIAFFSGAYICFAI